MVTFGMVAMLQIALGFGLVKALTSDSAKQKFEDLTTFDVTPDKPPEPDKPPPPPERVDIPPPPKVTAPPPVNFTPVISTNTQQVTITPSAPPAPPPPPPPPPPPAAPSQASKAVLRGSIQNTISADDYPPSAQRNKESGSTKIRVEIGTDGRVSSCTVTSSSGSSTLDEATCRLYTKRAKFTPAKDSAGNAMASSLSTGFRWVLPEE